MLLVFILLDGLVKGVDCCMFLDEVGDTLELELGDKECN